METKERGNPKTRQGVVVSDRMDKTVVVEVQDRTRHSLYGRRIRRTKRFKAHDETNECRVGDRVALIETRPLSKDKHWRVLRVVERAK